MPLDVVQCYFANGEIVLLKLLPHGNSSKTARPYFRTQPRTFSALKEKCHKVKSPSELYYQMLTPDPAWVKQTLSSISEESMNWEQLYNAGKKCSKTKSKHEIFDLLEELQNYQHKMMVGFFRKWSSPCAILASRQQLDNLILFCCDASKFVILGPMLSLSRVIVM